MTLPASQNLSLDPKGPTSEAITVTPSDTSDLPAITTWLWIGVGGNVAVMRADGTTQSYLNVPSGTALPIRVGRVMNTGTTASGIVANW